MQIIIINFLPQPEHGKNVHLYQYKEILEKFTSYPYTQKAKESCILRIILRPKFSSPETVKKEANYGDTPFSKNVIAYLYNETGKLHLNYYFLEFYKGIQINLEFQENQLDQLFEII